MKQIKRLRAGIGAVSVLVLACAAAPRPAAAQPTASSDEPAVITADELIYDQTLNLVTARGSVEISQGDRIVRADTVTYNRTTQVVTASGNVVLAEPSGDVFFANYAELTDDLKDGFVQQVSMLMADDSRLIGNSGTRERGEVTTVDRAVYSPCALCPEDPRAPPLWQIRAVKVIHDGVEKEVIYHDAFLDFWGIPVFYTPYFSHPDPTVDRRSGFLAPLLGTTPNLGPFLGTQYYIDIAENQDATLRGRFTRDSGVQVGGEYRYAFDRGLVTVDGSINNSDRRTSRDGNEVLLKDQWRWHLFGRARFDIDENWRAGADINRTSDDTYLKIFDITNDDFLTSRVFTEGFFGLSYVSAEALDYQDLRGEAGDSPTVAPWIAANYVSEPNTVLGGSWFANASVINLFRDEDPTNQDTSVGVDGVDTRRLSTQLGWQREVYTDAGFVLTARASARGDLYWSDDVPPDSGSGPAENGVVGARFYPVGTVIGRYPLVGQLDDFQVLVEPILAFTAAPADVGDDNDIPNNDSGDVEFDEINLFSDSRFPGLDRVEAGQRITYGLRTGLFGPDGSASTLFLGQSWRFETDTAFPSGSGLVRELSDYVGHLQLEPSPYVTLDWRFRLDADDLTSRRQNILASVGPDWLKLTGLYSLVDDDSNDDLVQDQEQIRLGLTTQVSDYWTVSGGTIFDIEAYKPRSYRAGLQYQDECFTLTTAIERDFTTDEDLKSGYSFYITLGFKNLGDLPFTFVSSDSTSSDSDGYDDNPSSPLGSDR